MAAQPEPELDLVFLWHMHQPDYRAPEDGEFALPWVYLHALKDYSDMAAHLERHPRIRAVVNFVPVLLDQIEDYVLQLSSGRLRDPLLRLLAHPDPEALTPAERRYALETCFRANQALMIAPFPAYQRLHDLHLILKGHGETVLDYLSGRYFADLVTWYHLAWTGETVRREHPLVAELMSRGDEFSGQDRQALLQLIGSILSQLIPRYRALAARGQIELSTTPYSHPLSPLLLDFRSAREAAPDLPLPQAVAYPGGRDRVDVHLRDALAAHQNRFGAAPAGVWPAEGALSAALVQRLAAQGCRWTASGESVLKNSRPDYRQERDLYRPHRLSNCPEPALFFRDDRLSDLIGFEYAKWHGKDAVLHFVAELDAIRRRAQDGERQTVCVIMDGENAWEFYPYNAYYFFEDLYRLLDEHPRIHVKTFSDCLADQSTMARAAELPQLVAGSWVYGSFTTWIGEPDKNAAWDLLAAAKRSYDLVMAGDRLAAEGRRAAAARLAVCESSDWFWWLGETNPVEAVGQFDRLFRRNLKELYRLLQLPPPDALDVPLIHGDGKETTGGAMRRSS